MRHVSENLLCKDRKFLDRKWTRSPCSCNSVLSLLEAGHLEAAVTQELKLECVSAQLICSGLALLPHMQPSAPFENPPFNLSLSFYDWYIQISFAYPEKQPF